MIKVSNAGFALIYLSTDTNGRPFRLTVKSSQVDTSSLLQQRGSEFVNPVYLKVGASFPPFDIVGNSSVLMALSLFCLRNFVDILESLLSAVERDIRSDETSPDILR